MKPIITLVLAHDEAGGIGHGDGLPWPRLPEDMKRFRDVTRGRSIVMGRRTMDTLGRPLPWRSNIVVTRDRSWHMDGVTVVHDVAGAVKAAGSVGEIMIVGGAEIYSQFAPMAQRMLVTEVAGVHDADVFWEPDLTGWAEKERTEVMRDGKVVCTFVAYDRPE